MPDDVAAIYQSHHGATNMPPRHAKDRTKDTFAWQEAAGFKPAGQDRLLEKIKEPLMRKRGR
jgi:hypothetical protein